VKFSAKLILAVLTLGMSACAGSLFQSKAAPPSIYVLSARPASADGAAAAGALGPAAPGAEIPVDLAVLKPRVRTGLETDRIAVLYPDRRLDYFADARWSGTLGEVLQDLAVQEFHFHAQLHTVSGDASVFASAYWLEIEVTDFQAEYGSGATAPTVRVHFLARIGSSGDRRILGQFAASAQQPATENRLTAIVDAYARAADAAMTDIVAQAAGVLAKSSEAR
jgi:cholesterol transport system auxiliary component